MDSFVKSTLTTWAVFLMISAIVYLFVGVDGPDERWFSRFIGGVICLGFVGVISAIQNKKI